MSWGSILRPVGKEAGRVAVQEVLRPVLKVLGKRLTKPREESNQDAPSEHQDALRTKLGDVRRAVVDSHMARVDLREFMEEGSPEWNQYVGINGRPGYETPLARVIGQIDLAIDALDSA